jgi:hypothetical protein
MSSIIARPRWSKPPAGPECSARFSALRAPVSVGKPPKDKGKVLTFTGKGPTSREICKACFSFVLLGLKFVIRDTLVHAMNGRLPSTWFRSQGSAGSTLIGRHPMLLWKLILYLSLSFAIIWRTVLENVLP